MFLAYPAHIHISVDQKCQHTIRGTLTHFILRTADTDTELGIICEFAVFFNYMSMSSGTVYSGHKSCCMISGMIYEHIRIFHGTHMILPEKVCIHRCFGSIERMVSRKHKESECLKSPVW